MNTELLTPITNPKRLALNKTTQSGVYIAGKFHVLDPLKVVTGYGCQTGNLNQVMARELVNSTTVLLLMSESYMTLQQIILVCQLYRYF